MQCRKTWVQVLGWEDPLQEGMVTHSSILAWRIPMDRGAWQANSPWGFLPGNSAWGCKESDMTEQLSTAHIRKLLNCRWIKCTNSKTKMLFIHIGRRRLYEEFNLGKETIHLWSSLKCGGFRPRSSPAVYSGQTHHESIICLSPTSNIQIKATTIFHCD